ncbi:minor tail protein [Gordonia phage Malibo]|nr:minor tail protein [Gordonia phage Malibo]
MPNRLWDDFRTPDISGVVGGTITLTAPAIRSAGTQTLADTESTAEIDEGTFEFTDLPGGPYEAILEITVTDPVTGFVRSNRKKFYDIYVAADGDQRFRDLIAANIEYPAPVVSAAVAAQQGAEAARDEAQQILDGLGEVITKADADAAYAPVFPDTGITYDGSGNVQTVTENGVTTTYTYNPDGTVATDTRDGVTRTYGYDGNGNLTSITVED